VIRCTVPLAQSSPAAALPANNSASRVYTRSISRDLWPVWSQTFIRLTPRFTAVVTRPDRKLCPPKVAGSKPSLAAAALTTLATLRAASR
jgi:hypothetical protein